MILSFFLSGCPHNPQPFDETGENIILENSGTVVVKKAKHALLIGIENYRNILPPNNDVKLIQGVLRERFAFQDKDFIILLNERATHTGIENGFKTLIERLKPGDFVYIHYSGHGSQTTDLNGDEPSGYDQTWVSYGTREPGGEGDKDNYDVLDDEINAWLAAIYAKTKQVIFVSDSCHSATVSRGKVPISRGLERDERYHPLGNMGYTQIDKSHGIRVGAARDKELAAETTGTDGKEYGLFTWYWAKALREAQVRETWSDVFKRTYTPVVSERGQAQMPQIEGEHNRQVFGGDFAPLVQTVSVSQVKAEWVEIQAGAVAGVTVGSVYRLHQSQYPRLEITQVEAFKSSGKILQGTFKRGDLVVEKSHAYHFDPIRVYLSADYPKDRVLLKTIQAAFQPEPDSGTQAVPGYVLTDDPYNTDLRLHLLRPKRVNGLPIYEKDEDALPKFSLCTINPSRIIIDVLLFEQEVFRQRGEEANLNPLEQILGKAAHGERGLSQVQNVEWVTGQVTFEVK